MLVFLSVITRICNAQEAAVFTINKLNGLSSNHIYNTLVDRHGYLWISTIEGVYKYNGYSLQKFDYSDGLSNLDIWNLYEDHKGRIWLCSISNHFGYIYNNNYRDVYKKASRPTPVIYPSRIFEYSDTLVFVNKASTQTNYSSLSIIVGDTLQVKLIADYVGELYHSNTMNVGNDFIEVYNDKIYVINSSDYINTPDEESYIPQSQIQCKINLHKQFQLTSFSGPFANRFIYYLDRNLNTVCLYDYKKNTIDTIYLKGPKNNPETPVHMYVTENSAKILTASSVYILDSQLVITKRVDLDSLLRIKKFNNINNTYFINNSFWGSILSTANNGLYISYYSDRDYYKIPTDLNDYRYVGKADDSTGFWWNKQTHSLQLIRKGYTIKTYLLKNITDIIKVVPFNNQKYVLLNNHRSGWLYKNGDVLGLIDGFEYMIFRNKITDLSNDSVQITRGMLNYFADCAKIDSNAMYMVGSSYNGLNKVTFNANTNTIHVDSIYFDKYSHISYNNYNKIAVMYSADRIMIINRNTDNKIIIANEQLQTFGINGVEKIMLDDFGNIFIKDYNKLIVANIFTNKIQQLFNTYQLEGAFIDLNNNILSLASSFGVITSRVTGPNQVTDVTCYLNTKQIFYDFVEDVQFSSGNVLLKTNKGTYLINTNNKKVTNSLAPDYKITLYYDTTLINIKTNDTISVDQSINSIGVDIIKPTGTGNLKIEYSINHSSTIYSDQIILPNLKAGYYNTIYLKASDNGWQSKPIKFILFVKPFWWQTSTAKTIVFSLSILFFISFVYVIIILTRKIVNQTNERRNQRRELELKSIYSQINPHFIFNSLSTAQYFVKKNRNKEAYEHINQFSDLLRSYIKSSRNKYITITEEVNNLENYLQLQLTRFEEKFDYNINIDPSVNPHIVKIPSLLLQPIVENALNHGIFHSETKGMLNVSFTIDKYNKNVLICTVDDDGIGRQRSKEIRGERIRKADSYGTILINELIDTFNKYEKIKIEIEYLDKNEPYTGTTVIIKIENFEYI